MIISLQDKCFLSMGNGLALSQTSSAGELKLSAMFEIVVSVALYLGALVLLVKGAVAYCNHDRVVTEP